jgi:hypothetical protein
MALALALGIRAFSDCSALADGGTGPLPGFQGFGLGYHLGYGYGGDALGVLPNGGFPFYAGPGYPCVEPHLRRFGKFEPFPYFGGPGYPTPDHPNYFGGVGPLVADTPVIKLDVPFGDPGYASGYGAFTGAPPNPEAAFAPFTTTAAAGGSSSGVTSAYPSTPSGSNAPPGGGTSNSNAGARALGFEAEPVVDPDGVRGLKVSLVYPGGAADKAGLRAGDVIRSINGYRTERPDHLAWIIAKAAPENVYTMKVRALSDGKEHTIKAQLP